MALVAVHPERGERLAGDGRAGGQSFWRERGIRDAQSAQKGQCFIRRLIIGSFSGLPGPNRSLASWGVA